METHLNKIKTVALQRIASIKTSLELLDTKTFPSYPPRPPARVNYVPGLPNTCPTQSENCQAETASEATFRAKRAVVAAEVLSELFAEKVQPDHVPCVGVAFSGGGTRAMTATLGFLSALQESRILNVISYTAAVSGSTWALAQIHKPHSKTTTLIHNLPPISSTSTVNLNAITSTTTTTTTTTTQITKVTTSSPITPITDALAATRAALSKNWFEFSDLPRRVALATAIERLRINKYNVNLVDLFGILLTCSFLETSESAQGELIIPRISHQASKTVVDGLAPLPIYCAVSPNGPSFSDCRINDSRHELYHWAEFTPFEFGLIPAYEPSVLNFVDVSFEGVWIPVNSFGRSFFNGISTSHEPEVSFGILLGVFGSAFTANLHRILQELESDIPPATMATLRTLLKQKLNTTHPLSPSTFPNPAYGLTGLPNRSTIDIDAREITLMDSGMDNSIPFAPLLVKSRGVDVIIVCDSSADIGAHPFIARADDYAKKRGIDLKLPRLDFKEKFIPSGEDEKGPYVVYLPLVGDAARASYAKAANFVWTGKQVDAVVELAKDIMKSAEPDILALLRRVWERKKVQIN
ncbi:hypothetical protein HK100_011111 [Physocladia obscura]|uniref:Lysophospholipase n=1 Tax=Physocladia obscura TaxID=109957 RepID=A0AAD5XGY5_9FUNG|nr:hypothetical protein HK100_011111 [Physocladia obscura]